MSKTPIGQLFNITEPNGYTKEYLKILNFLLTFEVNVTPKNAKPYLTLFIVDRN
jgi:hypothetical protein